MRYLRIFCLLFIVPATEVLAHPVSFKGGAGVMPEYGMNRFDMEANYTFERDKSVGLAAIWADTEDGKSNFIIPKFNYLALRENKKDSQANIYLSLGLGGGEQDAGVETAGLLSLQADYETRRIYTLFHAETIQASGGSDLNHFRYRLGMAPYVEGYEGVHTWLIGQVDYTPEMEDEWHLSPVLRVFYKNYLFEGGVSHRGDPFFAFISHF
jgi:hypothetical protein